MLELVEADLRAGTSFGDCHIHRWLSLADLEQLERRRSDVAEQHDYVLARLNRLMPDGTDLDALTDDEKAALYDALVRYALTLKPVHGEVKANTLYHALAFKLQRGLFDLDLFVAFLALPLPTQYPILSRPHDPSSSLQLTMSRGRLFPPVQPLYQALVTDLVRHFYEVEKEKKVDKAFGSHLDAAWLRQQCAIARLGAVEELSDADREKYAGWLGRELTQERDREILSFQPSTTAPDVVPSYRVGEAMELTLHLKNVGRSLLVKVYRVNAAAYYRMQGKEIDVAALDLAGVVAHYEDTVALPAYSAYRRFTHTLSVSALLAGSTEHGVFVCEVTAAGQKARALLRRAALSFLSHDTSNGVLMQLFDARHLHRYHQRPRARGRSGLRVERRRIHPAALRRRSPSSAAAGAHRHGQRRLRVLVAGNVGLPQRGSTLWTRRCTSRSRVCLPVVRATSSSGRASRSTSERWLCPCCRRCMCTST